MRNPAFLPLPFFISQYGGQMPGGMMGGPPPGSFPHQHGGYPGAFGAPAAQDPMWGYFTAIAGQVRLKSAKLFFMSFHSPINAMSDI